jgi:hypothetical protein
MLTIRTCQADTKSGDRCRQPPLRDGDLCFWHDPEHAAEAAEARRLGGLRRRRERTLSGAYEVESIDSVSAIRRVVEIVMFDALGMENTVARGRLLLSASQVAAKLLEVGEHEERLATIEAVLGPRLAEAKRR